MITLPHVSVFIIGVIVGYFGFYFLRRLQNFTMGDFGSFVGILFGGGAVSFILKQALAKDDQQLIWYYPIGMAAGLVIYGIILIVLSILTGGDDGGPGAGPGPRKSGTAAQIAWNVGKVLAVTRIDRRDKAVH